MSALLFLDIDGVLNPWAAPECPPGYAERPIRTSERFLARREQPTLLVPVDPAVGLTAAHVDTVTRWLA